MKDVLRPRDASRILPLPIYLFSSITRQLVLERVFSHREAGLPPHRPTNTLCSQSTGDLFRKREVTSRQTSEAACPLHDVMASMSLEIQSDFQISKHWTSGGSEQHLRVRDPDLLWRRDMIPARLKPAGDELILTRFQCLLETDLWSSHLLILLEPEPQAPCFKTSTGRPRITWNNKAVRGWGKQHY